MNDTGELPNFFDEGGLLDSEGYLREPIESILRSIVAVDNTYIALVSSRRPINPLDPPTRVLHLKPLQENEIKRLITMLANHSGLQLSSGEISELSEYVSGYPPAAYFAIQQVKYY
jgi:hypothetical protein